MTIEQKLEIVTELQEMAAIRAEQKYDASLYNYKIRDYYTEYVEFKDYEVEVHFRENTSYDPERASECLSIDELKMTDEEWNEYINGMKQKKADAEKAKKRKELEAELQRKEKEIGYTTERIAKLRKELNEN